MRVNRISDIDGLRKAYASESGAYVHEDTMYYVCGGQQKRRRCV